jgi:hypothetical protein
VENIEETPLKHRWTIFVLMIGLATQNLQAEGATEPANGAAGANPAAGAADLSKNVSAPVSASDMKAMLDQVQNVIRTQAEQLESQRQQLERQQLEIDELRRQVAGRRPGNGPDDEARDQEQEQAAASSAALLASETHALRVAVPDGQPGPAAWAQPVAETAAAQKQLSAEAADAPLSIHFGGASLTPGGWVDFTSYFRSTDVGSGLGTSFASIPYNNTVQGGLTEMRFTAQSSRISLRADEQFGAIKVFGYAEADFNGYLPSNAYVSTNSDSLRMRVYFSDVSHGRWELLGGQSWSLLTPNRVGVSPFLSEIYNTLHLDTNYQVGLTYTRQAQLRMVYHFTDNVALGFSAENPEQFSGSAVTFPSLFSNTETDVNSSTGSGGGTSTPTLHPDLIAKLSADAGWGERKWHFETAGLLTPVAILTPATVTKTTSAKEIREGGGISGSANLEAEKNLHLILTGFWSDGGGRYIGGLGPGFVVAQLGSKTAPFEAQLVHSGSGIASTEWQVNKSNVLSLTYSDAYFARVFSTDPNTGSLVGYGFVGSANTNNRAIQEGTFATQTTLWKRPGFGTVQVITQSSYITRSPWYVASNSPKDAHVFAGYGNLRYVLP